VSATLELAMALVGRPSVTPCDAGCQDIIAARLEPLGFSIERLRYGDVDNLWAHRGRDGPLLVFAGHTDVVPPGALGQWTSDPFAPTIRDDALYGRGAADMKGGLAAMVTAAERFLQAHPHPRGSFAFLVTSDEEGPTNEDGTARVVEHLQQRGELIDWCLIGEPTSERAVGDIVKNGRRGSLSGALRVHGVQGHVAYPHLAVNPIHRFAPALAELCGIQWDQGNEHFPPTTFQFSGLNAGTGAGNVIPGELTASFNLRYSTALDAEEIEDRVEEILDRHGLEYSLDWFLSGKPFVTPAGRLVEAVSEAAFRTTGRRPALSTGGGTSDGRFIAPTGAQVVELGLLNATIHKADENVPVEDLDTLSRVYERTLELLLL
jgi:succinyl-diaminopimelate desuccinylase